MQENAKRKQEVKSVEIIEPCIYKEEDKTLERGENAKGEKKDMEQGKVTPCNK